jgi:O-antigen biosynthesis protein
VIEDQLPHPGRSAHGILTEARCLAWAARRGLVALDLGAATNKPDGYLGVDRRAGNGVDMVVDLTNGICLEDSSVGVIRAVDFIEHIPDKVGLFNEIHRLLAHGGMLLSLTPSTDGRGAYQDPTHVAFYNENSFWYFTDPEYTRFVPEITCRFHVSDLYTFYPTPWHEQRLISYVRADLVAIKGESSPDGGDATREAGADLHPPEIGGPARGHDLIVTSTVR